MTNSAKIRFAAPKDASGILSVYAPFIKDTAVSFETVVPTIAEFEKRIETISESFPYLVCENDGNIVGYAYASAHRERAAYQWSVDLSIYIDPAYHRKRVATALYTALLALLKQQGYHAAFAGITVPNSASESFHKAFGFREVGIFENVGYKLGQWRDVKWMQLDLCEDKSAPDTPLSIRELLQTDLFRIALTAAELLIP